MKKIGGGTGQGALEYLIIVAAVLAIAAIVVLFLTGAFQSTTSDVGACKAQAASCATSLLGTPDGTTCGATVCDACTGTGIAVINGTGTCQYACNGANCTSVVEACQYGAADCIIAG